MRNRAGQYCKAVVLAVAAATLTQTAWAELYINEIYFDPPGSSGDFVEEYIELRGPAGMDLTDHYLVFLESEGGGANSGTVDGFFDLGDDSIGANGFLSLRQRDNPYTSVAGGNNQENTGSLRTTTIIIIGQPVVTESQPGWGSGDGITGPGVGGGESTVGFTDSFDAGDLDDTFGKLENAAFSALLIRNDGGAPPVIDEDLDLGDDGLDIATGKAGWDVLDSIGVVSEEGESEQAVLYGAVNFLFDDVSPGFVPNMPAGAEFQLLPYELEIAARWGNSTGQTPADWHLSNLTDPTPGNGLYVQSNSDDQPNDQMGPTETNQDVPFGTVLTDTIGGPNFLTGDFNKDGVVNAADYTTWRDGLGAGFTPEDYQLWRENFGAPNAPTSALAAPAGVPEPATLVLVSCLAAAIRKR